MKKILVCIALIVSTGCQSRNESIALLMKQQDELIASAEFPIRYTDPQLSKEDRKRLERHYPNTLEKIKKSQRLEVQDIIDLTRSGVADPVIIKMIEISQNTYFLTPENVKELEQSGVSKRVILAMQNPSDSSY